MSEHIPPRPPDELVGALQDRIHPMCGETPLDSKPIRLPDGYLCPLCGERFMPAGGSKCPHDEHAVIVALDAVIVEMRQRLTETYKRAVAAESKLAAVSHDTHAAFAAGAAKWRARAEHAEDMLRHIVDACADNSGEGIVDNVLTAIAAARAGGGG